jgi:hypothetical protein
MLKKPKDSMISITNILILLSGGVLHIVLLKLIFDFSYFPPPETPLIERFITGVLFALTITPSFAAGMLVGARSTRKMVTEILENFQKTIKDKMLSGKEQDDK